MGTRIVRFEKDNVEKWGIALDGEILVLEDNYSSLNDFLENGKEKAIEIGKLGKGEKISTNEVTLLSPVTWPSKVVCQGANYSGHRAESGLDASKPPFNLIFGKDISSLSGAYSEIVRPKHVEFLDYEIELGLVIGKNINKVEEITEENLSDFVVGLVSVNDVSARDVQILEGQWLKGKSYRTFGPTGPFLYLLDKDEYSLIHDLEVNLWVNDELRQSANTNQLLFKPAETLTELSTIMDFAVGDLVITGTAAGVAMSLSPDVVGTVTSLGVPFNEKSELFSKTQKLVNNYLKDGDVIRTQIKSTDGRIDLGEQQNKVVPVK